MMKAVFPISLCLASLLLSSCTQMGRQMRKSPSPAMSDLMETVEVEDEVLKARKTGDVNHELAEANADDNDIKKEVGVTEIDEEISGSEKDDVPYSKNFLKKKNTKRMQFWVEYFTKKQRERFQRFINNGEEYRHHIEKIFAEHGLPKELYFVGLIESGYYLGARSHASAVGPWQFIKGTGTRYGLKVNSELDERQDLFKASRAAAMYFKDLHNIFSSWELALAAYNAGEYGIIRRIMKHGTRDFYELSKNKHLHPETINYVPKVLAAMHVVNNAEKYGFVIPKKKNRIFDLTELRPVKRNTSLASVAKRLGVDLSLLKRLNPELRRSSTPRHFAGTYYLRVPQNRYAYRLGEVKEEPKVSALAVNFMRPETRKELNRRVAAVPFKAIKGAKKAPKLAQAKVIKQSGRPIVYKVRRGDNLTDLARIFNLKVAKIKTANKLKRGKILVGQKIILPDTQKGIYTVKRGDHLTKVARRVNNPVEALVKLNALKRRTIYPGQKIIVNID